MTYRALFFNALITLFVGAVSFSIIAGQRQMPMQMQDMEKEMAEANKAIEEYIASLPPAEQAEFNRQVEEFTQMFENMSDEDFEKFLGEMFNEDQMPQPDFAQAPQPILHEEVIEVPQLSAEQLKKTETALAILNDIIKQSNLFMVIVNSSPELPNRINQWGKKGIISDWQAGMTWDTLKIALETFIHKLYKIQEQDLTTKKYKFLLDLIADEALYNNIIQLRTNLNSSLPVINTPEFSIQKISAQSKEAIQNILKKYTESLYLLGIPKALDTIIDKYEPEAKKIREAEANANKKALDLLREPRFPAESSEAGVEPEMGYDYGGYDSYNYGDYSSPYYGGGYDSGYSPYSGGSDYNYSPDNGSSAGTSGGSGKSGGGSRTSDGESEPSSKDDKNKDKDRETEEGEKYIPNDKIAELIGRIKNNLETINATITGEDYPALKDLVKHVKEEDVNNDLASYILPRVIDSKIIALSDNIKDIDKLSGKLNSATLGVYQQEIKKIFDNKNKKELEKISKDLAVFEPLTENEKKEAAKKSIKPEDEKETLTKVDIDTLPADKRWAYFADPKATDELIAEGSDLTETIVHPKSLLLIKQHIDDLFKEVEAFGKKKAAPKPVAKKAAEPVTTTIE